MAGALAMTIVLTGAGGPPASDPDGAGDGVPAAEDGGDAPPAGFGVAGGDAGGDAPPAGDALLQQPQQQQQQQQPRPAPPAAPGDGLAAPAAPGAPQPVPPGALAFYTRADLMEFVESGDAASPVAALAFRFPVGGSVIDAITGGLDELEWMGPGAPPPDEWMVGAEPDVAADEQAWGGAAPADGSGQSGSVGIREGATDEPPGGAPFPDAPQAFAPATEGGPAGSPAAGPPAAAAPPSPDHSTTNVQVEGVDEPDFVKNDARHIYILDGGELTIVDALPADTVRVLSGGSAGEVRDSYRPEDASVAFRGPIGPPGDYRYDNMFLDGDSLIVIYEARQWASVPLDPADPSRTVAARLPSTYVLWVDIGNRSAPVPAGEYAVDGEYRAARMIDGTVYLVTRTDLGESGPAAGLPGLWYSALEGRAPGIPCSGHPAPGAASAAAQPRAPACEGPLVPPAYYVAPVDEDPALTTVSALPPGGSAPSAQTYLLGGDDIAYVSQSAAYLALPRMAPGPAEVLDGLRDTGLLRAMVEPLGAKWRQDALSAAARTGAPAADRLEAVLSAVQSGYEDMEQGKRAAALQSLDEHARSWAYAAVPSDPKTAVHRIEIGAAPAALSYAGAGEVRGEPLDQFSMDEHGGMLRIATNVDNWRDPIHTAVHVLDAGSMSVSASLEGIAPGETMRSARFAGDTLFLVTFRQVDPFFVVDMSGPVPEILGELKIPGFSTYLQPYGPDAVVGVGTYVSENLDDPRDWSVKVSLYDVSDYRRPLLADEAVIEGSAWSPAQSNHRALLADAEAGIVALPVVFEWGGPRPASAATGAGQPPRDGAVDAGGWTGFYAFRTDASEPGLGEASAIRHGAAYDGAPPEGRSLYIADWLYTIYDGVLAISALDDPGRLVKSIDLGR